MRVVIVDDNAGDRTLCRLLLSECYPNGFAWFEEETASKGLAIAKLKSKVARLSGELNKTRDQQSIVAR